MSTHGATRAWAELEITPQNAMHLLQMAERGLSVTDPSPATETMHAIVEKARKALPDCKGEIKTNSPHVIPRIECTMIEGHDGAHVNSGWIWF